MDPGKIVALPRRRKPFAVPAENYPMTIDPPPERIMVFVENKNARNSLCLAEK
jgi:hypothetical protein